MLLQPATSRQKRRRLITLAACRFIMLQSASWMIVGLVGAVSRSKYIRVSLRPGLPVPERLRCTLAGNVLLRVTTSSTVV